tara:strand:+ start:20179 stop:27528 length:7350 start_codon:yes stop_codon:yes gene_type:complete
MTYRFILVFCFIWTGIQSFVAQSENQLIKSSSSFFEKKQYSQAIDGYLQLLSNDLKNIEYNYCYGVCLFYSDNPKKSETYFNYLLEQSQCPVEVYYFKGRLHHLNYAFDKAIEMYENYIRLKTKKSADFGALDEIKRCQNAKELLKSPRAIQVVRQDQRTTEDYFSAYLFDSINYKLYSQDEFGKKYNTKKAFTPKYVFKRGMKYRFFSSYSNDVQSGKDIFYQKKNKNNNWDPPQRLSTDINTLMDEDFPFYDEHSGYLYFSSSGHNSMGGYDLFRSKFSRETLKSEKVENLNFPYSSTSNDFLFVPNLPSENVIFSTDRNQDIGRLTVVEARFNAPVLSSLLASLYFQDNIDPRNSAAEFYVTNKLSEEKFGPFNTNTEGTLYFIVPVPGLYLIEASIDGSERVFSDTIDIPPHVEGFEFEVSAKYEMRDSRETMSYSQNLIQISDMVVDIESIELHEFEKLMVNTKTIEAAMDLAIAIESKPMGDDEIESKMDDFIDLEVELEDQIRQKIKLIENINELYSKNDEVDEKIDYIINQNTINTIKEVDSLNPILYDLLVDRKIVVKALLDQKEYNESMSDLNTLQELYSEVTAFNLKAEEILELGNRDSLSRILRSTSIRPESIGNERFLSAKVRKDIAQMESEQIEIQARIDKKESERKTFSRVKSELASKLKAASNIELWDILSDSIHLIQQRISIVDKDIQVLSEKNEILEGQLIYAREGLLNITLIDAEGNDLENELKELNNKIDVDKYASTELYVRDKEEVSQSLKILKSNQNEERSRVRSSSLNKAMQDTIMLASEYEHIKALNQFGDQEDLVAENQLNILIQDSELIINSLSNKAPKNESEVISTASISSGEEPVISAQTSPEQTELAVNSPIIDQSAMNQELNSINEAGESNGSVSSIKAPIENEATDLIKAQDILSNSVSPETKDVTTNFLNNPVASQSEKASQETTYVEIVQNVNTDETQTIAKPSNNPIESSQNDSNIKTTKEALAENNISTQDESVNKNDEAITTEASEPASSKKSSKDPEIEIAKDSEGIAKEEIAENKLNSSDDALISTINTKEETLNTNESSSKAPSSPDNVEVLAKVSSKVEQQEEDISNISGEETDDEYNANSEALANQFEESTRQKTIDQDREIHSSDTTLITANKVVSEEDIASENQLNTKNNSSIQRDELAPSKEEETTQVNTEFESINKIKDETITDLSENNNASVEAGKKKQSNQNASVQVKKGGNSTIVNTEYAERNENDKLKNEEYTSQEEDIVNNEIDLRRETPVANQQEIITTQQEERIEEEMDSNREIPITNQQEISSTKAVSAEQVLPEEETSPQMVNVEVLDDQNNDSQFATSETNRTTKEQNISNSEVMSQGNDVIARKNAFKDEKNEPNGFGENSNPSIHFIDENINANESQSGSEFFNARVETIRFDNNEGQSSEFGESVKLLTALIFDAELEINDENSVPEPKRKKDKIIAQNRREEQQRRLAYFQNELSLELTNQNIENKYLRLKSMLPGVQFETIDNLNAQLLEIEIKEQDLLKRLARANAQNEINMLNKLIEANRSRKLMIEEELLEMQSFERNELIVATRAVNDREIESILVSERYLSYVEKRQKLQEANDLLNQLKVNNRTEMMALDASLRLSVNAKSLTEEQKQMVKNIRELQQAILYLEEEVKLRSSNLELESASADYEYLYQNGVNPSITSAESITLPTLSELSEIRTATRLNSNNKNLVSDEKMNSNNFTGSDVESVTSLEPANETYDTQSNVSIDLSSVDAKAISLENIPSESELNIALIEIKNPLAVLESKNYKSYVQDRILANRLAKDYKNVANVVLKANTTSNVDPDMVTELALKNAIDSEITKSSENNQNRSLTKSDLEKTFDYVSARKLSLIRSKLNRAIASIESYDSSMVYEALLRNEFTEIGPESTASLQQSLESLDLVDYSDNALIKSDFTLLNKEVVSKNSDEFEIGKANPSGLNFRVQVGAFRRPVRQDVYREFTPVSGQTLDNGLIVYMAGYFNNSSAAVAAQKQIRTFGYSDAFIVAYCNDERLAFWKGKEYERNGTCIANGNNSFVALNEAINSKEENKTREINPTSAESISSTSPSIVSNTLSSKERGSSEKPSKSNVENEGLSAQGYIRNRADDNINNNLQEIQAGRSVGGINVAGLFYSVQVGAFNRKIRGSELSKIRELDFYESNGLYRYSSGKFLSIDEARLRRTEVVNNGISDAFIVVFYNGKRITMQEARDLFNTNGTSVLYRKDQEVNQNTTPAISSSTNETANEINVASQPNPVKEFSTLTKAKQAEIKPVQKHTIKIIDKQKAPREKMIVYSLETDSLDKNSIERLNRVGVFHFNKDSSKIKSQAFKTSMVNSMLSFYTNGMEVEEFNSDQFIIHTIKMYPTMDGAFGNWLLRSKRTIGFTRLNKDIYLNFYLTSELEKDLLKRELKELRND